MRVISLRAIGALVVNSVFSAGVVFGQSMMADTEMAMADTPLPDEQVLEIESQDEYYSSPRDFGVGSDCGCPTCTATCTCGPVFYASAEALFLNRTRSDRVKILEYGQQQTRDTFPPSERPPRGQRPAILTTDALDFDYEWGPRITLGTWLNDCTAVEGRYYGLHHWKATATIFSPDYPNPDEMAYDVPFDSDITGDFEDVERTNVTYRSEFHNAELNLMSRRSECFSVFTGFRYINLLDELDLEVTDIRPTRFEISNYLVDAENHLVGWQLGGTFSRPITQRLSWDVGGASGLYVNFARQRTYMTDRNSSEVPRNYTKEQGELAFAGEVRFGLLYQVTSCMAVTGGYQLLWLEGVALAPEQLDFRTDTHQQDLNHDGSAFFDGGYIGCQIEY